MPTKPSDPSDPSDYETLVPAKMQVKPSDPSDFTAIIPAKMPAKPNDPSDPSDLKTWNEQQFRWLVAFPYFCRLRAFFCNLV